MRAVIQRVAEAKVTINGAVKGAIQNGLAVLLAGRDSRSLTQFVAALLAMTGLHQARISQC